MIEQIAGKEKIAAYFEQLLEKYGDDYRSLEWKSKESQTIRFYILISIISYFMRKPKMSVLDVGCGIGHFYQFLTETKLLETMQISYTGIDISTKMIEFAKNKFPKVDFRVVDLINDKFDEKYDIVISSGAFNIRMDSIDPHKETVREMLSRMYNICNIGVSVNFLSKNSLYNKFPDEQKIGSDRYVCFSEEEVLSWVKSLSIRFVIRRDYHPGDFTVFMLK